MRIDSHEVMRVWNVVVQEEEETIYIPGRSMVARLLLHKIVDLRWLQLLCW